MSNSDEFTATIATVPSASGGGYSTQIWTNFGPLTTTYTPPTECQTNPANQGLVVFSVTLASNSTLARYDCAQATNAAIQNPACYPSSSAVEVFNQVPLSVLANGYWSPGVFCPSGWSTAYTETFTPTSAYSSSLAFTNAYHSMIGNHDMQATAVQCCPSGYTLNGLCASTIAATTTGAMCDLNYACSSAAGISGSVCASNATPFRWDPAQTSTSIYVTAYPIFMMQQNSDLTRATPSTLSTHKSQSTSSSQGVGSGQQQQGGSSASGVKVIVPAVVVPVVALIAFVAAVIFCLRARKQRARRRAEGSYAANTWEKNSVSNATTDNGDNAYSWRGASPIPPQQP